jgi:molybdate transport system ATP-binding protein
VSVATIELRFTLRQGAVTVAPDAAASARTLALFGPSGSGKTSILEAIAGIRAPQAGRIVVDGRVLLDTAAGVDVPARRRRVGYVPQDALLFPHLDVRHNVLYANPSASLDAHATLVDLLELGPLLDRDVGALSGGERQRVALARALCARPAVLLLDEPLAAVDLGRRRAIVSALTRIRDELAVPFVYVTHAPEEACEIADQALVLEQGRVVAAGPPADVIRPA